MFDQVIQAEEAAEEMNDIRAFEEVREAIKKARDDTTIYFRVSNALKPRGTVIHCPTCAKKFAKVHIRHAFCSRKCWSTNYARVVMRGIKRIPKFMRVRAKKS